MYNYPNPCDTCEQDCGAGHGCKAWRMRFKTIWEQFNTYPLRQYRKAPTAKKFHEQHIYYVNKISHMAVVEDKDDPNMEWTKDTIDRRLLQIVGKDNFVPWSERM